MAILALGILALIVIIAIAMVIKNVYYVCEPNEVLIFSGTKRRYGNKIVGFRVIRGGRALRKPLFETVDRMDLTNMIVEVEVRNAYSGKGIPLTVHGVANVKIPGTEPRIHAAIERFLDRGREDIMRVARETLEGNLRGVLATLTPEEVNQDKDAFAQQLIKEAGEDFEKIGLELDTLKIQNVHDEVGYLDSVGRMEGARIRRDAQIAEASAQAEAAEVRWGTHMKGEVSKINNEIQVAMKENEKRVADAQTKREAMIAEQQAVVQAAIAQARAELGMQDARIEQVRLQAQADLIEPAKAAMREAIARAKSDAIEIVEQGKATAQVLTDLATTYRNDTEAGRDVLLMQKMIPILQQVSGTIGNLSVDRLTVVGAGGNGGEEPLASKLVNMSEQVKAATGLDVPAALRAKLGVPAPVSRPASRPPATPKSEGRDSGMREARSLEERPPRG